LNDEALSHLDRGYDDDRAMVKQRTSNLLVYCEKGAYTRDVRKLWKAGRIDLISFPYDQGDRQWHDNHKIPSARPSLVTINTCELRITDTIRINDTLGSHLHGHIARVLRKHPREFDSRHFDAAYKSCADVFLTPDGNYIRHADELCRLTGVHVIIPTIPEQFSHLMSLIEGRDDQ